MVNERDEMLTTVTPKLVNSLGDKSPMQLGEMNTRVSLNQIGGAGLKVGVPGLLSSPRQSNQG